jgi:hypothetical protein
MRDAIDYGICLAGGLVTAGPAGCFALDLAVAKPGLIRCHG